jgi:hypothetical protein
MSELIQIYGENLFEKESLLHDLEELTGVSPVKPFECVGTTEEVNLALWKTIKQFDLSKPLPFLLHYFSETTQFQSINDKLYDSFIQNYDSEHFLTDDAFSALKKEISCILSKN